LLGVKSTINPVIYFRTFETPVDRSQEIESLVNDGAGRLLARASDSRSLTVDALASRIRAAVDKYLLRDDPATPSAEIKKFMDEMQADDLCLIIACERGNENAWADLVARFTTTVRSAARSASANEDAAEDLAQSIWAELHGLRVREDGRPASKLAYYSGRGSLAGWLRAVVAQLSVDTFRKQSKLVQTEEETDLERLARDAHVTDPKSFAAAGVQNPEQSLSNRFAQDELQQALTHAVRELGADDRLLVKLYYFDNLRLREAGAVLGVHEATASRRLTRIQTDLRKRVSQILIDERGWTKAETERSFAEVAQYLEADLETLVKEESF
jgi:RNA polymerase sigma-70 factor (ECF subfamily)